MSVGQSVSQSHSPEEAATHHARSSAGCRASEHKRGTQRPACMRVCVHVCDCVCYYCTRVLTYVRADSSGDTHANLTQPTFAKVSHGDVFGRLCAVARLLHFERGRHVDPDLHEQRVCGTAVVYVRSGWRRGRVYPGSRARPRPSHHITSHHGGVAQRLA